MRRSLVELIAIAVISAAVGVAVNAVRRNRLPMRLPEAYYQVESKAKPILLPTARRLFDEGRAVFIDARPTAEYEASQIEGACNLPFERWQEVYPAISSWIVGRRIVVYGSKDGVQDADDLALAISSRMASDSIYVYIGGFEEWKAAGLPLRAGRDPNLEDAMPGEDGREGEDGEESEEGRQVEEGGQTP